MKDSYPKAIQNVGHIVDSWLPLRIQYAKSPGMSVGIIYKGKLLYNKGFGFADLETKEKVTEHTLYHVASISKPFTALAILQLVEKGLLRLDDKVSDHLEWFKAKKNKFNAAHITVRQMLSHSSGIFRDGDTPHWDSGVFPKDLKKSFGVGALIRENQSGFKYTNYGYSVLGALIEKVSGMSYGEYIQENILKPLGMSNTYPDYKIGLKSLAHGYGREIPGEKRTRFEHYKTHAYAAATGFISNVVDLSKLVSVLSLQDEKIISHESKKEMMHPHEKTEGDEEYGFGLDIFNIKGKKIVGHSGGFQGFVTQVMSDPKNEIGVVVLSNSMRSFAPSIARGIFESIYQFADKASEYLKKANIQHSRYEGAYRNEWGDTIIAKCANALIEFDADTNAPLRTGTLLRKGVGPDQFVYSEEGSDGVFGIEGESIKFDNFKNGKAQRAIFGATPLKRIKM